MALAAEVTAGAAAAEEAGKQPAQQEQDAVLQSHRAIVHQACRRLNRLMLPFALLFRCVMLRVASKVPTHSLDQCPGCSSLVVDGRGCAQQISLLACPTHMLTHILLHPLCSIIASLDRANLSFASVSMSQELGLSAVDYGLGSAIFFVSYSLFQVCLY